MVLVHILSFIHSFIHSFIVQSRSEERVPVVVVFTHMDLLKTREEKEKFRRSCIQWITFHNKQVQTHTHTHTHMHSV